VAQGKPSDPVRLIEDAESGDRFLIYGSDSGVRVELRYQGEALWMTQAQMADLFGVDVRTVNEHLVNIYAEGELNDEATIRNFRIVHAEGSRNVSRIIRHYTLDAVISVGYRVSSRQATLFRIWATDKLVQFATKGFVVDVERLKDPASQDRFAELREIIRDIRASEANVYAELRRILAICQDYDPKSRVCANFFASFQNKLHYAVTHQTAAELIVVRADATQPNMGRTSWPKADIRKSDVAVAKNYLGQLEIDDLNRATTMLLDYFEDQTERRRLVLLSGAEAKLDEWLRFNERPILKGHGKVSSKKAETHALEQYACFDEQRRLVRKAEADAALARALDEEVRKIAAPPSGKVRGRKKKND
jgi:hypothetical protein